MIQEQGSFSDMLINREGAAAFLRANVCSSYAGGYKGHLWWCSHEHIKLTNPPYTWSMIERELGLLDVDRKPKPVGDEIKKLGELLDTLPELSDKLIDSAIILSHGQNQWQVGASAFILAKRAGLTPVIASCNQQIPKVPLYIVPSLTGWASLHKEEFDALLENVSNGADMLITVASGHISDIENETGLRSSGMSSGGSGTISLNGHDLPFEYSKKFSVSSIGAEVIAEADGNVVFSANSYGK